MLTITTLNLNGIRSATQKGLEPWLAHTAPDFMCVQELKAQAPDLNPTLTDLAGYRGYFHCAEKKGYSGVGVYCRHEPSAVIVGFDGGEFDSEGRCLELCFDTPQRQLSVLSVYFPSGSSGPQRQEAKFRFLDAFTPYLRTRLAQRELVLCGDLNIAHQTMDLKNWKGNLKNSGFLPEERAWLSQLFEQSHLHDVYRQLHPESTHECYTWWSNRGQAWAKNVGWRIDYQIATPALAQSARGATIYKEQRFSDHAPLTICYDWHF